MLPSELQAELDDLEATLKALPDTPMARRIKVTVLLALNMRWEKAQFDPAETAHPHRILARLIEQAAIMTGAMAEILFIEQPAGQTGFAELADQEDKHRDLFDVIWDKYNEPEFEEFVDRYRTRIRINRLEPLIVGKRCIDFGCGNGVFCFALLEIGAASVAGIDFGAHNIKFANRVAELRGVAGQAEFREATVYDTGYPDARFDFAIQNGVFHHLNDQDRAYREVARVLKPDGTFWTYVRGAGAIAAELFDMAVRCTGNVAAEELYRMLGEWNVTTGKKAHVTDAFKASYVGTTYRTLTEQLMELGFGDFRRLVGGLATDYDHDRVAADPYGEAKYGEGDLRVLAVKRQPAALDGTPQRAAVGR